MRPTLERLESRHLLSDFPSGSPMEPTNIIPPSQMITPPVDVDPMDPSNTIPTSQMITPIVPPPPVIPADTTGNSGFSLTP